MKRWRGEEKREAGMTGKQETEEETKRLCCRENETGDRKRGRGTTH